MPVVNPYFSNHLPFNKIVGTDESPADRPWLHLDIAGTADNSGIVWQHQVPGATGTAVSTLYHLAQVLFETKEETA